MANNQESQAQNSRQYVSDNSNYIDQSSLQLRLDTSREVTEFEFFLRGWEISHINTQTGEIMYNKTCEPLANSQGIRAIKSLYSSVLSQHMAQGNLNDEMFYDDLRRLNTRIGEQLFINRAKWELQESNMELIRSRIMIQAEIFWTRPINNGERDSFTGWKIQSSDIKAETKKGINLWGGK